MDADRFDALSRTLSISPSRRGALRVLAGSAVASLFTLGAVVVDAHNALPACRKKKGKAKKKCLKKAKKHNATHASETVALPPPPPPPPPPPGPDRTPQVQVFETPGIFMYTA